MKGKWLILMRRVHLFSGVFFSPLLLMFIITGWWQTVTTDEEKEREGGFFHELIKQFSSVHTDQTWPRPNVHHSTLPMKILVVTMCVTLILSIALGLCLAWKSIRSKWLVVSVFVLGILVPGLLVYFV